MKWIATFALAAAAVVLSSAQDPCPPSFTLYDDGTVIPKCLLFLKVSGSWQNMLGFCNMFNGSLAVLTGDLHNVVYNHLTDTADLKDHCFWIGGTDQDKERTWVWEHDGSSISMRGPHWNPCAPEPNGGTKENYMAICPKKFYFSDYPGDAEHYAICQYFL